MKWTEGIIVGIIASSGLARGQYITGTLTTSANNDVLVGLDINPSFSNPTAKSGVINIGLRLSSGDLALPSCTIYMGGLGYSTTAKIQSDGYDVNYYTRQSDRVHIFYQGSALVARIGNRNDTLQHYLGLSDGSTGVFRIFTSGNTTINSASDNGVDKVQINGSINLTTAGNKIKIAAVNGAAAGAASVGTATLVNGTLTISTSSVTTNSLIMISRNATNASTALGELCTSSTGGTTTITNGVSFIVNSLRNSSPSTLETNDQSTFFWQIIN